MGQLEGDHQALRAGRGELVTYYNQFDSYLEVEEGRSPGTRSGYLADIHAGWEAEGVARTANAPFPASLSRTVSSQSKANSPCSRNQRAIAA